MWASAALWLWHLLCDVLPWNAIKFEVVKWQKLCTISNSQQLFGRKCATLCIQNGNWPVALVALVALASRVHQRRSQLLWRSWHSVKSKWQLVTQRVSSEWTKQLNCQWHAAASCCGCGLQKLNLKSVRTGRSHCSSTQLSSAQPLARVNEKDTHVKINFRKFYISTLPTENVRIKRGRGSVKKHKVRGTSGLLEKRERTVYWRCIDKGCVRFTWTHYARYCYRLIHALAVHVLWFVVIRMSSLIPLLVVLFKFRVGGACNLSDSGFLNTLTNLLL